MKNIRKFVVVLACASLGFCTVARAEKVNLLKIELPGETQESISLQHIRFKGHDSFLATYKIGTKLKRNLVMTRSLYSQYQSRFEREVLHRVRGTEKKRSIASTYCPSSIFVTQNRSRSKVCLNQAAGAADSFASWVKDIRGTIWTY